MTPTNAQRGTRCSLGSTLPLLPCRERQFSGCPHHEHRSTTPHARPTGTRMAHMRMQCRSKRCTQRGPLQWPTEAPRCPRELACQAKWMGKGLVGWACTKRSVGSTAPGASPPWM